MGVSDHKQTLLQKINERSLQNMKIKTKSGLAFELAPTSDKQILRIDTLLGKA